MTSKAADKSANGDAVKNYRPSLRRDLEWVHYPNQSQWVAHDPIASTYYRLSEFEYFAAQLMDGTRHLMDVINEVNRKFAAVSIDQTWLLSFVQRMQASFLLQPSRQSSKWIASQCKGQTSGLLSQLAFNPLSIKVPLFDPGSILSKFKWFADILFCRTSVLFVFLSAIACTALVLRKALENSAILAIDPTRITADRWLLLFACFIAAKSLHEFGHMLACARYGVRSTEVGLLFLCLTPCFYCETTDAWKLPSKWQRAMVAAAGIYVEIILAIVAAIVWLMSYEGTLHLVAFNLMLICSLSTILVNANPLFRFDGYFILSDLWQVPNLHEQSRNAVKLLFDKFIMLRRTANVSLDANPWLLATFAIASTLYRISMFIGILWFCWTYLPSVGMGLVAIAVSASLAAGMTYTYWRRAMLWRRGFSAMRIGERIWAFAVLVLFAGTVISIISWPVHKHVTARAYVDFEDKQPIYVSYDSKVTHVADCSRLCSKGSELLRLESPDACLELLKLEGKRDRIANELAQLKLVQGSQPDAGYTIPTLEKQLATLNARHAVLKSEIDQLVVVAPEDGYLIDGQPRNSKDLTSIPDDRFNHSVSASENLNRWKKRSELIGWFTPRQQPAVVALFPEHLLGELAIGMKTIVRMDNNTNLDLTGRITQIATDSFQRVPDSLQGDESLPSVQGYTGQIETEVPHYEVTIAIDAPELMIYGAVASVSVQLQKAPIYRHIFDYIRQSIKPLVL